MKALKILILFILGIIFSIVAVFYSFFRPVSPKAEPERFVVNINDSQTGILEKLQDQKFFRKRLVFDLVLDYICWQKKEDLVTCSTIKPGAYLISKSMNNYQLLKTILGIPYQKWVIIPPGKRKEQVAVILEKALDWSNEKAVQFIKVSKEGYLFPDTYLINTDYSAEDTAKKLTNTFNESLTADFQKELLDKNIRLDTAIRLASLIERESGSDEDKPIIAAIIWNRLDKNMRLEIDATVQYVLATNDLEKSNYANLNDFNFWPKVPAGTVRTIDSPYNTYLADGLPPAPICTPSLDSLKAVANPADTDALFYLHSADRQIHTAKTYKEHLANIQKYL